MLGGKECLCKSWLVQKFVCVEAGVCKTLESLEVNQKRARLVDARGVAVRVHAEKAASAEEE